MKGNIRKILICIYFILLGCVFLNTAFSKNVAKVSGDAEMKVANIKLNIMQNTSNIENLSNVEQSIVFTVNNFDGTKQNPIYSDVEYQYQISITNTNPSVPVQYELYKIVGEVETKIELTNGTSQSFTMQKSEIQEDEFILKVKMDNQTYKNISDIININVYAVQS